MVDGGQEVVEDKGQVVVEAVDGGAVEDGEVVVDGVEEEEDGEEALQQAEEDGQEVVPLLEKGPREVSREVSESII